MRNVDISLSENFSERITRQSRVLPVWTRSSSKIARKNPWSASASKVPSNIAPTPISQREFESVSGSKRLQEQVQVRRFRGISWKHRFPINHRHKINSDDVGRGPRCRGLAGLLSEYYSVVQNREKTVTTDEHDRTT